MRNLTLENQTNSYLVIKFIHSRLDQPATLLLLVVVDGDQGHGEHPVTGCGLPLLAGTETLKLSIRILTLENTTNSYLVINNIVQVGQQSSLLFSGAA
jgi:hypothetical protein